jgi:uncharacterized protein
LTAENRGRQRIEFLDVLRGVALFGILIVNVFSFGADSTAWTAGYDRATWLVKHMLFETKFWMLYSLLFGMSFYLQSQSDSYRLTHAVSRLLILMLLGCAHALLFEGDILMLYAELGLALLCLYRLPTRALLSLGVLLCLSFPLGHLLGGDRGDESPADSVDEAVLWLNEERAESPLAVGTLGDVMRSHAEFIPERFWIDWQYPDSGFLVLACFLFGVVIMRAGWVPLSVLSARQTRVLSVALWMGGIVLMTLERYWAYTWGYGPFHHADAEPLWVLAADLNYLLATLMLAAAWFFTALCWVKTETWPRLRARVASAGKMSLTAYLTQTAVFTTVFYGYGLGAAYHWGPAKVVLLAVATYGVQLILCHWWLQRFQRGPLEWLWRSLSRGERVRFRRA